MFLGLITIFGEFRTPEMTREQSLGRLLLGLFEVGLGLLLIILDAASTSVQTASRGLGVYRRDSAHPPGFPNAKSAYDNTCGLNENREQFSYQAKQLRDFWKWEQWQRRERAISTETTSLQ